MNMPTNPASCDVDTPESFFKDVSCVWSSGEFDRKRAGVMVSSDDIEAAGACDLPRLCVGDRGSGLVSLTIVIEGRIAVTIVALVRC